MVVNSAMMVNATINSTSVSPRWFERLGDLASSLSR
jgi:hypothetical protein